MLCMGRGTVRRTVEGNNPALGYDQARHRIEIPEHLDCSNPKRPNSFAGDPNIPLGIALWLITPIMRLAIDFDGKLGRRAIEVQ